MTEIKIKIVVKKLIEKDEYDKIKADPTHNFYDRAGYISMNDKTLYYILVKVN